MRTFSCAFLLCFWSCWAGLGVANSCRSAPAASAIAAEAKIVTKARLCALGLHLSFTWCATRSIHSADSTHPLGSCPWHRALVTGAGLHSGYMFAARDTWSLYLQNSFSTLRLLRPFAPMLLVRFAAHCLPLCPFERGNGAAVSSASAGSGQIGRLK